MRSRRTLAEVKARVEVRPARSQVFLVAVVVLAGIATLCGAGLFAAGQPTGWIFIVFAALLVGGVLWGWQRSQPDIDLDKSQATHLTLPDGTSVTTDIRTLRSVDGLKGLVRLIEEVLDRRPLPEPAGLLDSTGQIVPNSAVEARAIQSAINTATQKATTELLDVLHISDESMQTPAVRQVVGSTETAPNEIPRGLNMPIPQDQ